MMRLIFIIPILQMACGTEQVPAPPAANSSQQSSTEEKTSDSNVKDTERLNGQTNQSTNQSTNIETKDQGAPIAEQPVDDGKSSSADPVDQESPSVEPASFSFGANVGTEVDRTAVNDCNSAGKFYDRVGATCAESPLLAVELSPCDFETIVAKLEMTDGEIENFQSILDGELSGYLFDQCVDFDETQYKIYFAKEQDGVIHIKKLNIPKA